MRQDICYNDRIREPMCNRNCELKQNHHFSFWKLCSFWMFTTKFQRNFSKQSKALNTYFEVQNKKLIKNRVGGH